MSVLNIFFTFGLKPERRKRNCSSQHKQMFQLLDLEAEEGVRKLLHHFFYFSPLTEKVSHHTL